MGGNMPRDGDEVTVDVRLSFMDDAERRLYADFYRRYRRLVFRRADVFEMIGCFHKFGHWLGLSVEFPEFTSNNRAISSGKGHVIYSLSGTE